jgi:hypothetical protein
MSAYCVQRIELKQRKMCGKWRGIEDMVVVAVTMQQSDWSSTMRSSITVEENRGKWEECCIHDQNHRSALALQRRDDHSPGATAQRSLHQKLQYPTSLAFYGAADFYFHVQTRCPMFSISFPLHDEAPCRCRPYRVCLFAPSDEEGLPDDSVPVRDERRLGVDVLADVVDVGAIVGAVVAAGGWLRC